MKFYQYLLIALCSFALMNCSDDDTKKKEFAKLSIDGENYTKLVASYSYYELIRDHFELKFESEDDAKDDIYFRIQLDRGWDGKTLDLTENDYDYDWSCDFELYINNEDYIDLFWGYEDDMNEYVEKGTLYISTIDAEKGIFEITLDAIIHDKEYKLSYKGTFTPYEKDDSDPT
jgi:hypothetical protein